MYDFFIASFSLLSIQSLQFFVTIPYYYQVILRQQHFWFGWALFLFYACTPAPALADKPIYNFFSFSNESWSHKVSKRIWKRKCIFHSPFFSIQNTPSPQLLAKPSRDNRSHIKPCILSLSLQNQCSNKSHLHLTNLKIYSYKRISCFHSIIWRISNYFSNYLSKRLSSLLLIFTL